MAGGNASRTRGTAIALVAAALILSLPAIAAAAQCSRPERVDHRDAECLDASWKNRGIFKKSTFRIQNMCATYGTVVAKVDLVAASDMTLHLTDGRRKGGHAWRQIRSVSCCSDLGICNRSDAVTDEGCQARIMQASSAPLSCRSITATATSPGENYMCTIQAECYRDPSPFIPVTWSSTITVPFVALGDVVDRRLALTGTDAAHIRASTGPRTRPRLGQIIPSVDSNPCQLPPETFAPASAEAKPDKRQAVRLEGIVLSSRREMRRRQPPKPCIRPRRSPQLSHLPKRTPNRPLQ